MLAPLHRGPLPFAALWEFLRDSNLVHATNDAQGGGSLADQRQAGPPALTRPPFAALFLLDSARSGHNGCGRKCEEHIQQHLGRGDIEQLYSRDRPCFEHCGLRGFAGALHQARNRLAYRRLRDLWKHSHLPLLGIDRLPLRHPTSIEAHLENLRPLGDLPLDCRNLHAIPAR
jgi:hypothetical protein